MNLDQYQQALVDCNDPLIVGEAFAGAGKTTTAIAYTNARPKMRTLYLCFNKANQSEAARRFAAHVECRTTHSLAYKAVGYRFATRLTFKWRPRLLADELGIVKVRSAAVAQAALLAFFSSTADQVSVDHVLAVAEDWSLEEHEIVEAFEIARRAWAGMCDMNSKISLPHDAYLKMWAVSKPRLRYECIIVDEAQDTNPVTSQIVINQPGVRLLFIGDPYQSIYGFRGAKNAMQEFADAGATVLKLPRTWRFGPKTAGIANAILGELRGEATEIIGMGSDAAKPHGSQETILTRTNAALFAEAAACFGKGVHWIGGIENYRIELVADAYRIFAGRLNEVTDATMRKYRNWDQFEKEVESTRDAEGKILVRMIEEYRHDIPGIIQALRENACPDEASAQIILTTAHKSKGGQWPHVRLGEDFECLEEADEQIRDVGSLTSEMCQEVNLAYVGITRAQKSISLNRETKAWLNKHGFA